MEVDAQHGATWGVSSYESASDQVPTFLLHFDIDRLALFFDDILSKPYLSLGKEFLEAQGIAFMEQTQPWVAHTRRFAQRTISLPIPMPLPLNVIQ